MAKLQVVTNTGTVVGEFELDELDYLDYSAEVDAAIAEAFHAEKRSVPDWLKWAGERE